MSQYIIQKNTRLVIEYLGTLYYLDALGSYTYSQTFNKSSAARKTLHKKATKPLTTIMGKSAGSMSLEIVSTGSAVDNLLFSLLGMDKVGSGIYCLPEQLAVEPKYFKVYVVTELGSTQLSKCVLTGLSYFCTTKQTINLSASIAFCDIVADVTVPPGTVTRQSEIPTSDDHLLLAVNGVELSSAQSASVSFQQQISWREDQSIHEIGQIHVPSVAKVDSLPMNTVLTIYTTLDKVKEVSHNNDITISYGILNTIIKNATITTREVVGEVFTTQLDITLQENSSVVVEYGA